MKTCLVTGANGFIGSYLSQHLLNLGCNVVALNRINANDCKLNSLGNKKSGKYIPIYGDILNRELIDNIFLKYKFDEIYHLAGQSSPSLSWDNPRGTMEINFSGTVNILDAALNRGDSPTILLASSSAVYSPQKQKKSIKELDECFPVTPYGISKLAIDHLARVYTSAHGMRVISARPFFIIGPGKVNDVCSDWARNIVAIERGILKKLSIGAIEGVIRDFLPVEDAVEALILIAANGLSGEAYNISSGKGRSLNWILETFRDNSKKYFEIGLDSKKLRRTEELIKVGNNKKLVALGWSQKTHTSECLVEILNYWRANE